MVRFEEITRCPMEIQDTLLSVLSERVLVIPELEDQRRTLFAARASTSSRRLTRVTAA